MNSLSDKLHGTFDDLINILSKTSDTMLNNIPFIDSWSAGQVVEHIVLCGNGIPDNKTGDSTRQRDEKVAILKKIFSNMDEKSKADPALVPQGFDYKQHDLINQIKAIRKKLCLIAAQEDLNAICLDREFPTVGLLTRYEWLSFICFHTQRHTKQIQNIINFQKVGRSF